MTLNDKNELSPRQIKALPTLAATPNCDEACKKSGISRNSYYQWLKQPAFKIELERLRNEMVQDAMSYLKSNSKMAAETLVNLLTKQDQPAIQRAAANDILNHLIKFNETMEFRQRLDEIEKKLSTMDRNGNQ